MIIKNFLIAILLLLISCTGLWSQSESSSIIDFINSFEIALNQPSFSITKIKGNFFNDNNSLIEDDLFKEPPLVSQEANPIFLEDYLGLFKNYGCKDISIEQINPIEKKILSGGTNLYIVKTKMELSCKGFKNSIVRYFLLEENDQVFFIRTITFSYPSPRHRKWNDSQIMPIRFESTDLPKVIGKDVLDAPDKVNPEVDCKEYLRKIASLQKSLRICNEEKDVLAGRVDKLVLDTIALRGSLRDKERRIKRLVQDSILFQDSIDYLNRAIVCIKSFNAYRDSLKKIAVTNIIKADSAYNFYRKQLLLPEKKRGKKQIQDTLLFAWNIYLKYGVSEDSVICFGIPISDYDDFMNPRQHLNAAEILAADNGYSVQIMNSLADNPKDRLNKMTEYLLTETGKAYKSDKYNDISDVNSLVERLAFLLVPERKHQKEDITKEGGKSEAVSKIESIYDAFEKKDFAKAISVYNKYQRFFEMDGIKEQKKAIQEAQFAAGAILLWNYSEITNNKGLILENSWLDDNMKNRQEKGRELLAKFIEDTTNEDLKREAIILLRKHYRPENKVID